MNSKPLLIVLGEPYSVFPEILFKCFKKLSLNKLKRPIVLIGSSKLIFKQLKYFNYNFKINNISEDKIHLIKNNNSINIINVNLSFKKNFDKSPKNRSEYIKNSFKKALMILKKRQAIGLINGPVSKSLFLKKKFLGITEYLGHFTKTKNVVMLIYNKNLSVSPITTHLPLKEVVKKINKNLILQNVKILNKFYKKIIKKKPKIAILGLNPHCETVDKISEEKKIILPAIKSLKKKKIKIDGPYPADTFFLEENYKFFNLVIGMYHDQVLTPIKTIFKFNAINITVGLPFIRVSPDHGPNHKMVGKGLSNPTSLLESIKFFEKINEI